MSVEVQLLELLACPVCQSPLETDGAALRCVGCHRLYPVVDGMPDLRPPADSPL